MAAFRFEASREGVAMRSCALLSIFCATVLAGAVDEADPLKEELIKLEGVWKCVSIEWGGVKQEELARDYKLVLKGDTFKTISKGNVLDEGRVTRRDPTKNPKEFDFTYTGGRSKGRTMVGIYSLQADTYICCSAHIDLGRPKEFATIPGSRQSLTVYKRDKP